MGRHKRTAANPSPHSAASVAVAPVKQTKDEKTSSASLAVDAELELANDYLDMVNVPDADGLAHSGYLVLRCGEAVRILYLGSQGAGDEGWCYAEVIRTTPSSRGKPKGPATSPVGTRGWLPTTAVARPQANAQKKQEASKVGATALKDTGQAADAFVTGSTEGLTPGSHAAAVAEAVAAQRAAAAKAAAKAATKMAKQAAPKRATEDDDDNDCPICFESFGPRRPGVLRTCCRKIICSPCDQKGLSSGRCYFCRVENGDFPSLSTVVKVGK